MCDYTALARRVATMKQAQEAHTHEYTIDGEQVEVLRAQLVKSDKVTLRAGEYMLNFYHLTVAEDHLYCLVVSKEGQDLYSESSSDVSGLLMGLPIPLFRETRIALLAAQE